MTQQKELVQNKTPEVTKSKKEKWLLFFCHLFLLSLSGVLSDGSNFSLALRAFRSFACGFGTTAACFSTMRSNPGPERFFRKPPLLSFWEFAPSSCLFFSPISFSAPYSEPRFPIKKAPRPGCFLFVKVSDRFL